MDGGAATSLATKFINTEYGLNLAPAADTKLKITVQQETKYTIGPVVPSTAKKDWKLYMTFPIAGFDVWLTFAKDKTILNLMDHDVISPSLFDRLGASVFPSAAVATSDLLLKYRRIENPIKPRTIQSFFTATPEPMLWSVTIAKEEEKPPKTTGSGTTAVAPNTISTGQDIKSIVGTDSSVTPPAPADSTVTGNTSGGVPAGPVPKDQPKVYRINWEIKYISKINFNNGNIPLVGLVYSSKDETWTGKLLFSTAVPDTIKKRLPAWNPVEDLPPGARDLLVAIASPDGKFDPKVLNGKTPLPDNLNIWTAFGIEQYQPPSWIPSLVQDGSITYGLNQDNLQTIGMDFTIVRNILQ